MVGFWNCFLDLSLYFSLCLKVITIRNISVTQVQQQLARERQEKECQAREVEELKQKEQAILQEMQDKQVCVSVKHRRKLWNYCINEL